MKESEIIHAVLDLVRRGHSVTFSPDALALDEDVAIVIVNSRHTHVGSYNDGNREQIVDDLHRLFINNIGLKFE